MKILWCRFAAEPRSCESVDSSESTCPLAEARAVMIAPMSDERADAGTADCSCEDGSGQLAQCMTAVLAPVDCPPPGVGGVSAAMAAAMAASDAPGVWMAEAEPGS